MIPCLLGHNTGHIREIDEKIAPHTGDCDIQTYAYVQSSIEYNKLTTPTLLAELCAKQMGTLLSSLLH